jgi:hypothetical protein
MRLANVPCIRQKPEATTPNWPEACLSAALLHRSPESRTAPSPCPGRAVRQRSRWAPGTPGWTRSDVSNGTT